MKVHSMNCDDGLEKVIKGDQESRMKMNILV